MGLDMYMYAVENSDIRDFEEIPNKGDYEINYWRKFNNLHGFFEDLGCENCRFFQVTEDMLDQLFDKLKNKQLHPTTGFFYGQQNEITEDEEEELFNDIKHWTLLLQTCNLYYFAWY